MNKPVLVFGSGRSGTSWLCETMAKPKGYRLLFEPEHEQHVPEGKILTDKLLEPDVKYPDADRFLNKLIKNRVDNDWIAQHSYRRFKLHLLPFLVKKVIVKFVRCNLSMHYITHRFNVSTIYIQRNPYATIYSQHRVKFPWLYDLNKFEQQQLLREGLMKLYNFKFDQHLKSPIQLLTIRWCIENIFPFEYFKNQKVGNIISVNYNEIAGNIQNYKNLLVKVNLQPPENLNKLIQKPSSKTHPKSDILTNSPEINKFSFTSLEMSEINQILQQFEYPNIV